MKIEFIKETKANGDVIYFTEIEGRFMEGTLSLNEEKGREYYNGVLSNGGVRIKEVISSIVLNDTADNGA
jgi:hypothetical protein